MFQRSDHVNSRPIRVKRLFRLSLTAASPTLQAMPCNARKRSRLCLFGSLFCLGFRTLELHGAESEPGPAFQLPNDFTIERVAGTPQLHFPMFGTLDDRGRLFVTESSGGDLYAELARNLKNSRISRLTDTNGDGRYDVATVFTDGLSPSMGLVWHDGKLYAADPPGLVVFEDAEDDGRSDRRTTLLQGFGHSDNGSLHGLTFGPDGWLYFTMGNPDSYDLTGPDGSHAHSRTGALIRCRPDGSRVETVTRGFENLVEVAWLRDGSMIGTVNWFYLPERGVRDALVQLLDGGQYPLHAFQRGDMPVDFQRLLPPLAAFPAVAHSGLMRYRGDAFPPAMRDSLFSAEHNTRKVVRHVLSPKGASYAVQSFDFINTDDPNVHFSDVLEDADGSLLAIDTGSWYVHHCPTGRILQSPAQGGIYRVRYQGRPTQLQPARLPARDRETASTSPDALLAALGGTNPIEVAYAARALGRLSEKSAAPRLIGLLVSSNLQLREAAAEALANCGDVAAVPAIITALADRTDDFLTHALTFDLHRLADRTSIEAGLDHPSPKVQRAALLLLAQPPFNVATEKAVSARMFSEDASLRETARWVLARHPEWGQAGATFVNRLLTLAEPTDADRTDLEKLLPLFTMNSVVIRSVADALSGRLAGIDIEQRGRLLDALCEAGLESIPAAWALAVRQLLAGSESALRKSAVHAARIMKIAGVEPDLQRIARDAEQADDLRVSALSELVRRQPAVADPDFEFLEKHLAAAKGAAARMEAAETLLTANLTTAQILRWLKSIREDRFVSPVNVLTAVERHGLTEDVVLPLLDYLTARLDAGQPLPVDRLAALQNTLPTTRRAGVQPLLDRIKDAAAHQKEKLAAFEPLLAGRDRGRGQELFYGRAQCSVCHSVWGIGGKIGPDLTKIGSIRAGRDILESIVFPSATIAQGYEVLTLNLKDGEQVTGIRVGKSEDPLILRDAAGNTTRQARQSVASIERSALSLMPEGLLGLLTGDETRDLLAFLQGLK